MTPAARARSRVRPRAYAPTPSADALSSPRPNLARVSRAMPMFMVSARPASRRGLLVNITLPSAPDFSSSGA
jgi:hypothetical protein